MEIEDLEIGMTVSLVIDHIHAGEEAKIIGFEGENVIVEVENDIDDTRIVTVDEIEEILYD